jgi:hypothetical protein
MAINSPISVGNIPSKLLCDMTKSEARAVNEPTCVGSLPDSILEKR